MILPLSFLNNIDKTSIFSRLGLGRHFTFPRVLLPLQSLNRLCTSSNSHIAHHHTLPLKSPYHNIRIASFRPPVFYILKRAHSGQANNQAY